MKGLLRLTGSVLFSLVLFAILFSFAMVQGGFLSWFLFYGFLPIFLYHLALAVYPIRRWQITRRLSRHIVLSGDRLSVTVTVKRKIPFPLYYCIFEESFAATLDQTVMRRDGKIRLDQKQGLPEKRVIQKLAFPGFRRTMTFDYELENIPRGEHRFYAVKLRTGDLFGFIKKEYLFPLEDQLIAYPKAFPVHINETVYSYEQGYVSSRSKSARNSNVAVGIREYMPGDKFSWIDWKQTARKNSMMTKEFEQEKTTDSLIVLNSCQAAGKNLPAFEAAVEMTISLMETIRKQSSAVDFLSIGEETIHFSVRNDPVKMDLVKKYLVRIQPLGFHPFPLKWLEEMGKIPHTPFVIVVTTTIDHELAEAARQLKMRKTRLAIIVIQAEKEMASEDYARIQRLEQNGIGMTVLTEKQFAQNPIEVDVL